MPSAPLLELDQIVSDLADALAAIDQRGLSHKSFKPGIGPFGEADAVRLALTVLKELSADRYSAAVTKRKPDLLLPGRWQIEVKLVRPFGDNGKEAENWSQNVLHPYAGNTSSIGDCMKLLEATGPERRAVVVFGFEHDEARITIEPCVCGFEILAAQLCGIRLAPRIETTRRGLVHPVHQVLKVYAWEVLGFEKPNGES